MERRDFGEKILFGGLGLSRDHLLCLQRNSKEKYYDVTFYTITKMEEVKGLVPALTRGILENFKLKNLCRTHERVVTVRVYNPWITEEATSFFLSRYVKVLHSLGDVRDSLGIWTGNRQFKVSLTDDPDGYDGFRHPPATFKIGNNRGYLFYAGQPLYCRQCATYGHVASVCKQVRCGNCGNLGHSRGNCSCPKKCSLCGSEGHLFKSCPAVTSSYAHAVSRSVVNDPQASSLSEIEEALAEIIGDQEIKSGLMNSPVANPGPQVEGSPGDNDMKGDQIEEENPSKEKWVEVDSRIGKRKRKKGHVPFLASGTPWPLLGEKSKYSVLLSDNSEEEEEIETKQVQGLINEIASQVTLARGMEVHEQEAGDHCLMSEMSTPGSDLPPSGIPVQSKVSEVAESENCSLPESCSLSEVGGPPG